jgi:hypothetical protein
MIINDTLVKCMDIVCNVACKHFFSLDVAFIPERSLATTVGHYAVTMPYEYQQNIGIVIINLICSQVFIMSMKILS